MSDEALSRIEDLPNELWVEVFNYLDWINLILAFHGINKRINQLLMSIKALALYSSCLINHSDSIYIFFQEFPLKEFKQIQHFQLIYDNPYEDALNIAKHFASFSSLISLTIEANCSEFGCKNQFAMIIFRQNCPFLQRLHLNGNVFDQELQILDNVCTFHFPSLLYIHVSKLHFILAVQLLDQCPQLRSFSAKLYGHPMWDNTTSSPILLSTRVSMGLLAMKKLSIGEDNQFENEFGSTFLELLLSCCPNLRTLILDIRCRDNWERLLEADWWAHVFASDNKLKRISLHLQWSTRNIGHNWLERVQRFRSSLFFTQLKANIRYDFSSEFMRSLTYDLYIKN